MYVYLCNNHPDGDREVSSSLEVSFIPLPINNIPPPTEGNHSDFYHYGLGFDFLERYIDGIMQYVLFLSFTHHDVWDTCMLLDIAAVCSFSSLYSIPL